MELKRLFILVGCVVASIGVDSVANADPTTAPRVPGGPPPITACFEQLKVSSRRTVTLTGACFVGATVVQIIDLTRQKFVDSAGNLTDEQYFSVPVNPDKTFVLNVDSHTGEGMQCGDQLFVKAWDATKRPTMKFVKHQVDCSP